MAVSKHCLENAYGPNIQVFSSLPEAKVPLRVRMMTGGCCFWVASGVVSGIASSVGPGVASVAPFVGWLDVPPLLARIGDVSVSL